MSVKSVLDLFGKRVVQQSRTNLTKSKKKDTGGLYDSISYKVTVHKNSFSLSISMDDHGEFVDKGVKGKSNSSKAPNSPFKFGSGSGKKGGLTDGVNGWVKRKRIQFRDKKTGRFLTSKATAFIITRSIYQTGLETTNFITKPFKNEFKKLPEEIIEAYGLEVESLIKMAFKK
jgi:hypothetical protein